MTTEHQQEMEQPQCAFPESRLIHRSLEDLHKLYYVLWENVETQHLSISLALGRLMGIMQAQLTKMSYVGPSAQGPAQNPDSSFIPVGRALSKLYVAYYCRDTNMPRKRLAIERELGQVMQAYDAFLGWVKVTWPWSK